MRARSALLLVVVLSLPAARARAAEEPEAARPSQVFYPAFQGGVNFSPDSKRVAFGVSRDGADAKTLAGGNLQVCEIGQPKEMCRGFGGGKEWAGAVFSPDGRYIAAAGDAGGSTVGLWSADGLRLLRKLSPPPPVRSLAISPDGKLLAMAQDHRLRLYSAETGALVRELESVFGGIGLKLKEADGRILVEEPVKGGPAGEEGVLAGDELREGDGQPLAGLTLLQAVARLRGEAGTKLRLTVFRPSQGKERKFTIKRGSIPDEVSRVFFLPDGRLAAIAGDGTRLWAAGSGAYLGKAEGALLPDGHAGLLNAKDGGVAVRSFPEDKELCVIKDYPKAAYTRFSSDSRTLAVSEASGRVTFFDLRDCEARAVLELGKGSFTRELWVSPDGRYFATAVAGEPVKVYEDPLAPRRFVAKADAELKSTTGKVLTRLPLGAEVAVERYTASGFFVRVGESLKGYIKAGELSLESPDVLKPVIRVTEKSFDDPVLYVKGVVYDDKAVASVQVGGTRVAKAGFEIDKGNYADAYPFEAKVTLSPDTPFSIKAEDASGKATELPIDIEEPVLDYTPRYVQVETLRKAGVRKSPSAEAGLAASLGARAVVTALGEKDGWYCLEGGGWLAKEEARELSAAPAAPAEKPLSLSSGAGGVSPKVVREASDVDTDVPRTAAADPDAVAVVIGVRDYKNKDVPAVEYALADARAFRDHLVGMLGVPEGNVIYLEDPTQGDFARVFGTHDNPRGQLYDYVKPGKSDVFVYYSGHGAPDLQTKSAYFVPSDATPDYVRLNGYPLDRFYANLARLPARSVLVVLDACFSGSSHKGLLLAKASPLVLTASKAEVPASIDLFSSSGSDEVSSWYPEKGHSLFTYYFLRAMRDVYAKDKSLRLGALRSYLEENVPYQARRMFGRSQRPQFQGNERRELMERR